MARWIKHCPMRFLARRWWRARAAFAGCPRTPTWSGCSPLASPLGTLAAPWHIAGLPHQTNPTRFAVEQIDGRRAVRIESESAYGKSPCTRCAWTARR